MVPQGILLHRRRAARALRGRIPERVKSPNVPIFGGTFPIRIQDTKILQKKMTHRSLLSFYKKYPQANSNRCLHRERVLS